ncbi:STAS domain-containing protein [Paenibacillus chartarius]|uniref:STAS domain-containing protein n=1 Tax=Paenibacillus chartarius TaxID=747481 RepID=A0ABV6DPG7_9BACL
MPASQLAALQNVFSEKDHIIAEWLEELELNQSGLYRIIGAEKLQRISRTLLEELTAQLPHGLTLNDIGQRPVLEQELNEMAMIAAENKMLPSAIAPFFHTLKTILLRRWTTFFQEGGTELHTNYTVLEQLIEVPLMHCLNAYTSRRERVIYAQSRAIAELSTPVIQLWDNVLAMPLVGEIDSVRAKGIMEGLLGAIAEHQVSNVILDITGVPVVDSNVADSLIKTVEAAKLLGANCILTGIRPEVAQTIVLLGVNLGEIVTKASLRAGLAYILSTLETSK